MKFWGKKQKKKKQDKSAESLADQLAKPKQNEKPKDQSPGPQAQS